MAEPITVTLGEPIQFGTETITHLTMSPSSKHMRDFSITTTGDGGIVFEPYAAAKVGVHMAGQPNAVLDLMHPADLMRVAKVVMDFFGDGPPTGGTASPP